MSGVMFVCMGNVCRSPLAHILFEKIIEDKYRDSGLYCDSSGVNVYSEGQPVCRGIVEAAAERGIVLKHRSRSFRSSDAEEYDLILAMDRDTFERLEAMMSGETCSRKVRFFREFDPLSGGRKEVPDPYGGNEKDFRDVYSIIERTVEALAKSAVAKKPFMGPRR